jgi:hypothetical protein
MSPEFDKRIPAALLILRFFLATFLLQWSIEKLILPGATARIANNFYGVTLPVAGSYALGVAELIVCRLRCCSDSIGRSATASRCSFIP